MSSPSQLKNEPSSLSSSSSSSTSFSLTTLNNSTSTSTSTLQQQQSSSKRIRNINTNTNTNKSDLLLLNYFWTTIDEIHFPTVSIPCIYRRQSLTSTSTSTLVNDNDTKNKIMIPYVCVRIIERSILTHFEHMNSAEIKAYGCLLSVPCTHDEVMLLNEINTKDFHFGVETFSTRSDSMVKLSDFKEFYKILIDTCPVKATSTLYQRPPLTMTTATQQQQQLTTFQLQPINLPSLQVNQMSFIIFSYIYFKSFKVQLF
jgi:hypothetical protein